MRSLLRVAALGAITVTGMLAAEHDARACGGCFTPVDNPSVVTDHRMILSISKDQSTLYDQIKYSGSPAAFAWVLPISGTVQVGLSSDIVFQAIDTTTQTQVTPPPLNCPAPTRCFEDNALGGAAPVAADAGTASEGGVTVTKEEVVGPYETVQLKATDANALENWLATNNFTVPDSVKPVVDQYVTEKFDFLALKLIPGATVQDMRPVRVTTMGANAVLPLRMVAAGTGASVGIALWIVGEGRYAPQNFPTFSITSDDLAWDWTQSKSNYTEIRAQKTAAGGGRAWEIESSTDVFPQNITQSVESGYVNAAGRGVIVSDPEALAEDAYLPVKDADGNVTKTAVQVRTEDLTTLFYGVPAPTARITRLRSDLAHAALDADLVVTASADQSLFPTQRRLTKELNEPLCPVYDGCSQTGTAPRSQAIAETDSNNAGANASSCAATKNSSSTTAASPLWLGAGLGVVAFAFARTRRRRG